MPDKNEFIPTDFSIYPEEEEVNDLKYYGRKNVFVLPFI